MAWIDRFRAKPPKPDKPRATSGRAHTDGFLDYDERNAKLIGDAGVRQFDEMWRTDGDVRKAWLMCINPIVGATWEIEPYGGDEATDQDREVAKFVQWNLLEFMRPRLAAHLLESLRVLRAGFAPFEQIYTRAQWEGRDVLALKRLGLLLPRHVFRWIDDGGELKAIQMSVVGRKDVPPDPTVPAEDLVYYRVGGEGDNWEGESPLRPAYKHWKYKTTLELVDAIAHEKFAVGVPVAYGDNLSAEHQQVIEDALANLRANEQGYIFIPVRKQSTTANADAGTTALIEILQPAKPHDLSGSLKYHSDRIAASVLAEFMRLGQENVGARATADVQVTPFEKYLEAIASVTIEDTVNEQLIPRLVALNFPTDRMPSLRCSGLDEQSLNELAAFLEPLVEWGTIHPDDDLEDFLRRRADLPPADPKAREERKRMANEIHQQTLNPDPEREEQQGEGGKGNNPERDKPKRQLARQARALRPFEAGMALDRIEMTLDAAREDFVAAGRETTVALAARYTALARADKRPPAGPDPDLRAAIADELTSIYDVGRETVRAELAAQAAPLEPALLAREENAEQLTARAGVAAEAVQGAMWAEIRRRMVEGGDDAVMRQAGEAAARGALRREAMENASTALNMGRSDEAEAQRDVIRGAYYTSILDGSRCQACADADDDVLRSLDDPVLQANSPPNPNCHGGGRCRCMLAYVYDEESIPSA